MEQRLLDLDPGNYIIELSLAEDLIGLGKYEKARELALGVVSKAQAEKDIIIECIARFFILVSYSLKAERGKNDTIFENYLNYYQKLGEDFKVDESWWIFKGLHNTIINSRSSIQTKIILIVLLKIIQGEMDGNMRNSIKQMINTKESS